MTPRRVHAAPNTAVLYVYDPAVEVPLVEPAPNSLVVVVPTTAPDIMAQIEAFFDQAATEAVFRKAKRL